MKLHTKFSDPNQFNIYGRNQDGGPMGMVTRYVKFTNAGVANLRKLP